MYSEKLQCEWRNSMEKSWQVKSKNKCSCGDKGVVCRWDYARVQYWSFHCGQFYHCVTHWWDWNTTENCYSPHISMHLQSLVIAQWHQHWRAICTLDACIKTRDIRQTSHHRMKLGTLGFHNYVLCVIFDQVLLCYFCLNVAKRQDVSLYEYLKSLWINSPHHIDVIWA